MKTTIEILKYALGTVVISAVGAIFAIAACYQPYELGL